MLSARFKPYHIPLFLAKYAWLTARRKHAPGKTVGAALAVST